MENTPIGYPLPVEIIGILILVGVIAFVLFKKRGQKGSAEPD
ncbi:hypothetical protein [Rhodococcus koreensis]